MSSQASCTSHPSHRHTSHQHINIHTTYHVSIRIVPGGLWRRRVSMDTCGYYMLVCRVEHVLCLDQCLRLYMPVHVRVHVHVRICLLSPLVLPVATCQATVSMSISMSADLSLLSSHRASREWGWTCRWYPCAGVMQLEEEWKQEVNNSMTCHHACISLHVFTCLFVQLPAAPPSSDSRLPVFYNLMRHLAGTDDVRLEAT